MISPEMINKIQWENDADEFYEIIAQADDENYSESGYVVVYDKKDNKYAIGHYSHCSCYGTWAALGDERGWSWVGTKRNLIKLAKYKLDPDMIEREADPQDYDYRHLISIYQQILQVFKK